jgi:hypothetical protein
MAHKYVIYGLIRPHIGALFIIYLAIHNGMGTYVLLYSGVRLQGHPAKMTVLQKFYLIFVPERHFCGVSQQLVNHSVQYCTLPDLRHESHVLIRNEGHFHFYYCLWNSDKK